ncbi:alpha/beta fold hydrolase [Propionibacteriaceae bacterium Y1700]|uniref:alpha/beta fold hydrolase n=1 Tax=Microlunatus sp. Y1700 TaxID=3418487 RepID=UPI003DA77F1F
MTSPHTRAPRWKRAVGLTVAPALLASGALMLATPSPADAAPKVPKTAKLAGGLAKQKLTWETCDFGDPGYNERFNRPNVKCATVKVPRDWHNPDNGKTWDIRISQAKNREVTDGNYKGTIFANPGGPGGEGLVWGPAMEEFTPDLRPYYNYVGFDPRGVGQSSTASCDYTWDSASTDPYAELKAAGKACSQNEDVKTINTEQTTYDMDFIRHLLKAPKLSYVGFSYGTWLGAWYEKVFGTKYGDKFVLDSAIDATQPTLQSTWELQPVARDRQFNMHMMNWIARHDDTYGLGTDPQAIHDRYFKATANLDDFTIMLLWVLTGASSAFPSNSAYPVAGDVVQALIEIGEEEGASTAAKSANPAADADALLAKIEKRTSDDTKKAVAQARDDIAPLAKVTTKAQTKKTSTKAAMQTGTLDDPFDFIRCNDGQWTQGEKYWEKKNAKLAKKAPLSDSWGLLQVPVCAFWPTNNLMPVADEDTFPQTIVVQGEQDSQTGWEGGYKSGTKLPNTSFIAIDNEGSHGHFPYGTEKVDRPIINFFLKGKQPKDITVAQAKPLPEETKTYESWAKLNKKAKHVGPDFTDPFDPAGLAGAKTKAMPVSSILAEAESEQLLRDQVAKEYGEEGVKALESAGTL